jgi:hypothetical protein
VDFGSLPGVGFNTHPGDAGGLDFFQAIKYLVAIPVRFDIGDQRNSRGSQFF